MKLHTLAGLVLAAGLVQASFADDAAEATLIDCTVPNAIGGTCPDASAWHGASEPHAAPVHGAGAAEKHASDGKQAAHAAASLTATAQRGASHAP